MKGPGLRYQYDVLRLWQCPKTHKYLKSPVNVTSMVSPFVSERVMMKLVESKRRSVIRVPVEQMYSTEFVDPFPPTEPKVKSLPSGKRYLVPRDNQTETIHKTIDELPTSEISKDQPVIDAVDFEEGIFDGPFERPSEA